MDKYCFGVDVGGTTVKMGLFDESGTLHEKWEIPTRTEESGKHILSDVAAAIQNKMKEKNIQTEDVIGTGIGVAGRLQSRQYLKCGEKKTAIELSIASVEW